MRVIHVQVSLHALWSTGSNQHSKGHFWPIGVKMRTLLLAFVAAVLVGCASGSALVTGQARPAIEDFTTVTILTEMPDGAEQIAIIKASSDAGFTQQQSLDYAVEELKKQAAKVGANAVVLTNRQTDASVVGVPTHSPQGGTMIIPYETEVVQGVAVYVD